MSFAKLTRAHKIKRGDRIRFSATPLENTVSHEGTVERIWNDPISTEILFEDGTSVIVSRARHVELLNDRR